MKKSDRIEWAKRATAFLNEVLPKGLDSHQDDIDNAASDLLDQFPVDLDDTNEFVYRFWDNGWRVTYNDIV